MEEQVTEAEKKASELFFTTIVTLARDSFKHDKKLDSIIVLFMDDKENQKIAVYPIVAGIFLESGDRRALVAQLLQYVPKIHPIIAIGKVSGKTTHPYEACQYCFYSKNINMEQEDMIITRDDQLSLENGSPKEILTYDTTVFRGFLEELKDLA